MPIKIPNLGPSSSGPALPGVSVSDAIKPALALSNVGRSIGNAGDKIYEHDMKIMEAENAADLTEFKNQAKTAYANRQASFEDNPNHLTFKDEWNKDLDGLNKTLSESGYSNSTTEKAKLFMSGFESDSKIGVASSAQGKSVQRRDQAFKNGVAQLEKFYDPNNPDVVLSMFGDLLDDQNFSPEVREAAEVQFAEFAKRKSTFAEIHQDARGWMKKHSQPKGDFDQWQKDTRRAQLRVSSLVSSEGLTALDAIYSSAGMTDKDLIAMTPTMRPSERARVIDQRDRMNDARVKQEIGSLPYQATLVGEVADLLATYTPDGTYEDDPLLVIETKIRQMNPGLSKERLSARLEDIKARAQEGWDNEAEQAKTVSDWSMKQLDSAFATRKKKIGDSDPGGSQSLGAFLDDKFLEDEERLENFGYTEDQRDEIVKAAKAEREAKLAGLKTPGKKAVELVRLYWSESNAATEDFPKRDRAVFQAIRDGKTDIAQVFDPIAAARADVEKERKLSAEQSQLGMARMQMAEMLAADPDMSMESAAKIIEELGYEIQSGGTGAEAAGLSERPVRDTGEGKPGAYLNRSDVPYNGIPASIRYNNPGAAYPRAADEKYGLIGYGVLNSSGQGIHKIGRFPTPTHGAAANFDLFNDQYVGMTAYAAVRKWRGNSSRGEKTVVPAGYDDDMEITPAFLQDSDRAIDFFKKMAMHESPSSRGMTDSDWLDGWQMWRNLNF